METPTTEKRPLYLSRKKAALYLETVYGGKFSPATWSAPLQVDRIRRLF